jgi:hypothetical protein
VITTWESSKEMRSEYGKIGELKVSGYRVKSKECGVKGEESLEF